MLHHEPVGGLAVGEVSALRYSSDIRDPHETAGMVASLIPSGSRVLDVGCGTGSISAIIRDISKSELVGVEPNPERARAARERGLETICGYLNKQLLEKVGSFDAVIFADVLEHLVDPVEMLLLSKQALKPDGRIIASVPNVAHWTVRMRLLFGRFDYRPTGIMDATHLRWFTRQSICRLFDEAGLQVEKITHTAGAWMGIYNKPPLRLLPSGIRASLIWQVGAAAPGLFACQHIVAGKRKRL